MAMSGRVSPLAPPARLVEILRRERQERRPGRLGGVAAGVLPEPLRHDEVMEVARRVKGEFSALLEGIIERL